MSVRAYLDWNATAPLRGEAREAMLAAMEAVGNPSSVHAEGREARRIVEEARGEVAALVGAEPGNVIFTSGGTEANALALSPRLARGGREGGEAFLLVSFLDHPSIRAGGRFPAGSIVDLPVEHSGAVDPAVVASKEQEIRSKGGAFLASVMLANNETGVIQPIARIAEVVHAAGALLHVDAVQAAGKIPCDIKALGADLVSISAHKLGGPKGVGALIKAREDTPLDPILVGGGQQRGARAGTENVIGISGFGAAAKAAAQDLPRTGPAMARLRDAMEARLCDICAETVIFGTNATDHALPAPDRLPNTTLFAVPGASAETSLIALDLDGVAVSSGSACSSGKVAASHVLAAMGVPAALAACALRVSIGPTTTSAEIELFLNAWSKRVAGLSKGGRELAA